MTYKPFLKMYQPATDMVPTRYRLVTGKLPITYPQVKDRAQNCSFHFQSIVSLAMDSEHQFPEYTARKWSVMSSMCIPTKPLFIR